MIRMLVTAYSPPFATLSEPRSEPSELGDIDPQDDRLSREPSASVIEVSNKEAEQPLYLAIWTPKMIFQIVNFPQLALKSPK